MIIKHNGYLRTRGKCRKHKPQVSIFYISLVFSKCPECVISQGNTQLRFLHLLYYDRDFTRGNNKTRFFYALYFDKTAVFDQSERMQGPSYIIILFVIIVFMLTTSLPLISSNTLT